MLMQLVFLKFLKKMICIYLPILLSFLKNKNKNKLKIIFFFFVYLICIKSISSRYSQFIVSFNKVLLDCIWRITLKFSKKKKKCYSKIKKLFFFKKGILLSKTNEWYNFLFLFLFIFYILFILFYFYFFFEKFTLWKCFISSFDTFSISKMHKDAASLFISSPLSSVYKSTMYLTNPFKLRNKIK